MFEFSFQKVFQRTPLGACIVRIRGEGVGATGHVRDRSSGNSAHLILVEKGFATVLKLLVEHLSVSLGHCLDLERGVVDIGRQSHEHHCSRRVVIHHVLCQMLEIEKVEKMTMMTITHSNKVFTGCLFECPFQKVSS